MNLRKSRGTKGKTKQVVMTT